MLDVTVKKKRGSWNGSDVKAVDEWAMAKARENFWVFRKWIHPNLIRSWFQYDAAKHLQQFYADYRAGKRPKLLLSTAPQHGKSMMVIDFIVCWQQSGRQGDLCLVLGRPRRACQHRPAAHLLAVGADGNRKRGDPMRVANRGMTWQRRRLSKSSSRT